MRVNGRLGRMGEFLAAFLFEEHGVEAMHVDRDGADLVLRLPDGRMVSVDVKACQCATQNGGRLRYQFQCRGPRPDYFALVALDTRLMVVLPSTKVGSAKTLKRPPSAFTPEVMRRSIEEMTACGRTSPRSSTTSSARRVGTLTTSETTAGPPITA